MNMNTIPSVFGMETVNPKNGDMTQPLVCVALRGVKEWPEAELGTKSLFHSSLWLFVTGYCSLLVIIMF